MVIYGLEFNYYSIYLYCFCFFFCENRECCSPSLFCDILHVRGGVTHFPPSPPSPPPLFLNFILCFFLGYVFFFTFSHENLGEFFFFCYFIFFPFTLSLSLSIYLSPIPSFFSYDCYALKRNDPQKEQFQKIVFPHATRMLTEMSTLWFHSLIQNFVAKNFVN